MEIPKEIQDRLDALPEGERLKAQAALEAATSPDINVKWEMYAEHFFAGAPEVVLVQAKHLFYAGCAAMMACAAGGPIPEATKEQVHTVVANRARDELRLLLARLKEVVGPDTEIVTHEVTPREGQSIEEAIAEAQATVEAQHSVKH